jgi:hypothetical protein
MQVREIAPIFSHSLGQNRKFVNTPPDPPSRPETARQRRKFDWYCPEVLTSTTRLLCALLPPVSVPVTIAPELMRFLISVVSTAGGGRWPSVRATEIPRQGCQRTSTHRFLPNPTHANCYRACLSLHWCYFAPDCQQATHKLRVTHCATSAKGERRLARSIGLPLKENINQFFGLHSRANFCASAICAGVILLATRSRPKAAHLRRSFSDAEKPSAAKLYQTYACT